MNRRILSSRTQSTVNTQSHPSSVSTKEHYCFYVGDTWYYDHFSEPTNYPTLYEHLLSNALSIIWIWDPYLNEGDEVLFDFIKRDIDVKLLTFKGFSVQHNNKRVLLQNIKAIMDLKSFTMKFKFFDKSSGGSDEPFHDRYLFVDDDVYIVGASLSSHRKRVSSTSIHKIVNDAAKILIRQRFDALWNNPNSKEVDLANV